MAGSSSETNCILVSVLGLPGQHVKCWGDNGYGQAGQGNTQSYGKTSNPGQLAKDSALLDFGELPSGWWPRQVSIGSVFGCAILAPVPLSTPGYSASTHGMAVRCWGQNNKCALGVPDTSNQLNVADGTGPSLAEWPNTIFIQATPSPSASPSSTPSPSVSGTPTQSVTSSSTATPSSSVSPSASSSASTTATPSASASTSPSVSATPSSSSTPSPSTTPLAGGEVGAADVAEDKAHTASALAAGPAVAVALVAAVLVLGTALVLWRRRTARRARTARQVSVPPAVRSVQV